MEDIEFSSCLKEGDVKVDDWKRDEIISGIQNSINVLCALWDVDLETILDEGDPIEIDIYGEGAEIDRDRIKISEPDSYRAMMRNLFNDKRVTEAVDTHYPVPFHEVPEEVGQIIGERADNSWNYEEDMVSRARDELHGAMALTEFYPWFIDREVGLLENNMSIILELNSDDHVDYLDYLQDGKLNRLKNRLEKISDRKESSNTYQNTLKTGILNQATDILENRPPTVQSTDYAHEELPGDFSERILEEYLSLDELADYDGMERILNEEAPYSVDEIADNIETVSEFDYGELETLQERITTDINTERDRVYLISLRMAKEIYGEAIELSPAQIINSTPEIDEILQESIYTADRQIKSEYGL